MARKHLLNPHHEFSKTDLTRQNENVSDESARGICLVGIPNPLFHTFTQRLHIFCAKHELGLVNSSQYFQFYYTISELQLKINIINLLSFKSLINKKVDIWGLWGGKSLISKKLDLWGL